MVDKISDERFKEEMLRLMRFTVLKVGENVKEIGLLKMDVERNTRELKKLRKDIRTGFGFDNDLWFRVLEMYNRLHEIESRVNSVADRFPHLKVEYKRIFSEVSKTTQSIDENPDAKIQFDELNVWLENLEEKVFD